MSQLLKLKSKVGAIHKTRKTYEAFEFMKRPRDPIVDQKKNQT